MSAIFTYYSGQVSAVRVRFSARKSSWWPTRRGPSSCAHLVAAVGVVEVPHRWNAADFSHDSRKRRVHREPNRQRAAFVVHRNYYFYYSL